MSEGVTNLQSVYTSALRRVFGERDLVALAVCSGSERQPVSVFVQETMIDLTTCR